MKPTSSARCVAPGLRAACALAATLFSTGAIADASIRYRVEGTCNGDVDEVQLKEHWLRADSHQGDNDSSMIYDGAEKLAYFLDHGTHTFMQMEMDEDAVDLQKDVMTSLSKNMKNRAGFDPFAMASSLCPGLANADNRDRLEGEAVDCGNGTTLGGAAVGADGKPTSADHLAAAMQNGQMPAGNAESQQMLQQMMEKQMASMTPEQREQIQQMMGSGRGGAAMQAGAMPMPGGTGAPPAPSGVPQRIDRDAGEIVVDGITCSRRQHLRGDTMLREDCYATVATLKLGDVETRRLGRFTKSLQAWSRSMAPAGARAGRDRPDDRVLIQRTCFEAGHESGKATLTIDRAAIAESRFAVPSGYKPMDMGAGMQETQGRR